MKVAVIGGGIAGLAAAHRLTASTRQNQVVVDVTVFEASSRLGGIIETVRDGDCIVELGPDSFTTLKPGAIGLCTEIGLTENLISTNNRNRRAFIARDGRLNAIPQGFVMIAPTQFDSFFESNILSRTGKLRMAVEQFIKSSPIEINDESVASFVRRRFGPEAVDMIAQPMLGGIYTADIDKLSLRATMPKYLEYESKFGSVASGLRDENRRARLAGDESATDVASGSHEAQSGGARYSAFVTFDSGMQLLVARLAELIGVEHIFCDTKINELTRAADGKWLLTTASGDQQLFDQIVLAVPTMAAAGLLRTVDEKTYEDLAGVIYASSVVACLVVPRQNISHPLDGFGFVVPKKESRSILACSFSSIKFPGRCADDSVLLRVFLGGALDPDIWQLPDDELLRIVRSDLSYYIGLKDKPDRYWIKRWPHSMPQYNIGHLARAQRIDADLARLKGIYYAGAGLRGVGVPDCVSSGESAARAVLSAAN